MDPGVIRKELLDEFQSAMGLVAAGYPMSEISADMEMLSRLLQGIAVCHLLETLDAREFRVNLLRSVQARCYFLRKSREQGNVEDRRLALGRTEALFDALAAGHRPLLLELSRQSIMRWDARWEYEDDHLYFHLLQSLATTSDAGADLLKRYGAAMQDRVDARLQVARALVERNASAFEESLLSLMQERHESEQARHARLLEPDLESFLHWPRCFVSVEGLALLALAGSLGITTPAALPLCPAEGRLPADDTDTEDFFVGIERLLSSR